MVAATFSDSLLGLARRVQFWQYLPKGTNLSGLTQRLNNRPRLRLGYKTTNEVFYNHFVALQI
jgi:IS30 family transposase